MKKWTFSDSQIVSTLKQGDVVLPTSPRFQ